MEILISPGPSAISVCIIECSVRPKSPSCMQGRPLHCLPHNRPFVQRRLPLAYRHHFLPHNRVPHCHTVINPYRGGGSPNGCEKNCTIGVSIGGSVVFVGILACVLYFCYKHNYPAPSHGSPSPVSPVEEGVPPTETPPGTTLPPVSALAFAYALLEWLSYSFQHFWGQLFNTSSTTVDEPETSEHVIIPDPVSPPHQYLCPITHEIMTDPVNTEAGQTYERAAIESWFRENHSTDPMTGN